MKNKKLLAGILVVIILLTSGCGSSDYIKDKKGNIVINSETGQNLQTNIFCRPSEDTEAYKLYKKYEDQLDVKLSKLPECEDFKITSNKTKSLWQFLFVKPLAYLILKLGNVFKSWGMTKAYLGLSLMIIGLAIRLILLPFTLKTQKQSKNMQKAMPEIQRLEKKYEGKTDQESMMLKAQEQMAIYKKYKVNPTTSCLLSLIQLPVFFAFLQAIYKIPTIYEGEIFGMNLGTTPKIGIFTNHNYMFALLVILIIATTYFSFQFTMKQTSTASADQAKQTKTMLIFMTVFIGFASFSLPTAIGLYWIVTYAFIIIQTILINYFEKRKESKTISKKTKSIKNKLKTKEGMKYGKNN